MENNQREVTPNICKQELWFLCMTHRLIMLYKCTQKAYESNVLLVYKVSLKYLLRFGVIKRTRNCMENNQREITPKI